MTTETVLTDEQIKQTAIATSDEDLMAVLPFARAIEQAVLQSAEVQRLREDAERLDWLDGQAHCADWVDDEPTKRVIRAEDGEISTGGTWREAIDAAMEKQP